MGLIYSQNLYIYIYIYNYYWYISVVYQCIIVYLYMYYDNTSRWDLPFFSHLRDDLPHLTLW